MLTNEAIDHLIDTAKTSWVGGNPGSLGPGMTISVQPAGRASMRHEAHRHFFRVYFWKKSIERLRYSSAW